MNKTQENNFKKQYNEVIKRINTALNHFDQVGVDNIEKAHLELFFNLLRQAETVCMMFPEARAKEILNGFEVI